MVASLFPPGSSAGAPAIATRPLHVPSVISYSTAGFRRLPLALDPGFACYDSLILELLAGGNEMSLRLPMRALVLASFLAVLGRIGAAQDWLDATAAHVPQAQQAWGKDVHGEALFICRAQYAATGRDPGWHLGKFRKPFNGCHISYGGAEVEIPNFQVLSNTVLIRGWMQYVDGQPNDGTIHDYLGGGQEGKADGGQPLYVCRSTIQDANGIQLGKFRPEFKGCQYPFGGNEVRVGVYELALIK